MNQRILLFTSKLYFQSKLKKNLPIGLMLDNFYFLLIINKGSGMIGRRITLGAVY